MGSAAKAVGPIVVLAYTCATCRELKGPEAYSKNVRNAWGLQSICKECQSQWQRENPEKRRDSWNRYRKATYLVKTYGITLERYAEIFEEQGGVCAVCLRPGGDPRDNRQPLHVDHDHSCCSTKKTCGKCVRGLLCKPCNTALGALQDDPVVLARAITYLARHAEQSSCLGPAERVATVNTSSRTE